MKKPFAAVIVLLFYTAFVFTCGNMVDALSVGRSTTDGGTTATTTKVARELMRLLIEEENCFTTKSGAVKFGERCAASVVYEDFYEPQSFVGTTAVTNHMLAKVAQRQGKGGFRVDKISDGNRACGFTWTWTSSGDEDGLRGITFVELNDKDEIQYVREVPEPIYKPGAKTLEEIKAATKGVEPRALKNIEKRTPTVANEVAKYIFLDYANINEMMRFFDDNVAFYEFHYDEPFRGVERVRKFMNDCALPGIEFRPERFDDGIDSTCVTWQASLEGTETRIRGISFYELSPQSRKVVYVCGIPEPSTKPPPLAKLARFFRPGLGVFWGVKANSR